MKLTQAGERLLPYALEILDSMRKAESIVQEPEEISGKLNIGTCESYVTSILPSVIMEFSQQCPPCGDQHLYGSRSGTFADAQTK